MRVDQFHGGLSALRKRPNGFSCGQMLGYLQQSRKRSDRARRDHIKLTLNAFGLGADNFCTQLERFDNLVEEIRAKAPRFDQSYRSFDQRSDHDSGQSCARADIDPAGADIGLEPHQLRRIEDVPIPNMR
ncbi:MAG TPA: hypothetical protein VKB08_12265 [Bradyrhizobium sp.]|nr:hypothetical protein [Bradyrhizobium sp.]